jgi:CRP/FNR family cyclic AMP-dependent transcriptional regulator
MNAFAARRSPFTGFGVRSSEFPPNPQSAIRNSDSRTPEFWLLYPGARCTLLSSPGTCLVAGTDHRRCPFPPMTANERQHFLRDIPIFAGLDDAALLRIAGAVQETLVPKGSIIVSEGEPGDRMFVVYSGRVEVVKHLAKPNQTLLAVFGPKDFMGEMSIIECVARSASLRAMEETFLFALRGIDLYHLFQRSPDQYAIVILNIARDLSRRLRALDEKFAAISH